MTHIIILHNTGATLDDIDTQSDILKAIKDVLVERGGAAFEVDEGWGEDRHLMMLPNDVNKRAWLHDVVEGRITSLVFLTEHGDA